jgi:mannose-6-phosphate isomerase-like protein (cupin superfamily)
VQQHLSQQLLQAGAAGGIVEHLDLVDDQHAASVEQLWVVDQGLDAAARGARRTLRRPARAPAGPGRGVRTPRRRRGGHAGRRLLCRLLLRGRCARAQRTRLSVSSSCSRTGSSNSPAASAASTSREGRHDRHGVDSSRLSASNVHFTGGARTAWHTHPNGQTIWVTEGVGLCQRRGGRIEVIRPGDCVLFEPRAKTTSTVQGRTASWHTSRCSKSMKKAPRRPGATTDEEYAALVPTEGTR